MGRTKIETNISFDEKRKLYYVTLNWGKTADGKYSNNTSIPALIGIPRKQQRIVINSDSTITSKPYAPMLGVRFLHLRLTRKIGKKSEVAIDTTV